MKTKMTKAMYGKSMMKKGGSIKKMQAGGKTGAQLKKEGQDLKAKGQALKAKGAGQALKAKGAAMKKEGQELRKEGMYVKENPYKAYVDRKLFGENVYQKPKFLFKKGGVKKPLRKAQEGENFQGPVTQEASNRINKEYTRNTGVGPRVYDQKVKDADELKRLRENYDRIPKEVSDEYKRGGAMKKMQAGGIARPKTTTATNKFPGSGKPTKEAVNNINTKPKKMQKGGLQKAATKRRTIEGGTIKKMMTGGMVNPNSSVSAQKTAGSKGVQSGVNPKASSSKVAGSRGSGRANTPPSKAVPTAKRGGMVKKKR